MSKKIIDLVREAQPNYGEDIILIKVDGKLHEVSDREISEDSQYDLYWQILMRAMILTEEA